MLILNCSCHRLITNLWPGTNLRTRLRGASFAIGLGSLVSGSSTQVAGQDHVGVHGSIHDCVLPLCSIFQNFPGTSWTGPLVGLTSPALHMPWASESEWELSCSGPCLSEYSTCTRSKAQRQSWSLPSRRLWFPKWIQKQPLVRVIWNRVQPTLICRQ